jgi:hypothetical protein
MLEVVSSRVAADTHIQSVPRLDVSALVASKLRHGEPCKIPSDTTQMHYL